MTYFIGIDLGQVSEATAIVVVEANVLRYVMRRFDDGRSHGSEPVFFLPDGTTTYDHPPVSYAVRHIDRLIGARYPEIVLRMNELSASLGSPSIAVDATGVGRAALELFRGDDSTIKAITLTGGDAIVKDRRDYRVPKRDLVTTAQVLLQTERLKIARSVQHGDLLGRELQSFRVKIDPQTAKDSYLSWRENQNDDLVLALCVALWIAEDSNGGIPTGGITVTRRPARSRWSIL
jgi:hypothetical protein